MIRQPAVAGKFYPADQRRCIESLDRCIEAAAPTPDVDGVIFGGVVPHAGWTCSGPVAAKVYTTLAANRVPDIVVLFGAVHHSGVSQAAAFCSGRWQTPLGLVDIDERFAERLLGMTNLIADEPFAHRQEHSIEVQVPFVQRILPDAKLLPILVSPGPRAAEIGHAVARTARSYRYDIAVIASSDLTHYGRRYGFAPMGTNQAWAKDVNDARVIERMCALDAVGIVEHAREYRNACGSGAIAAAMAATRELGADRGLLLQHTTSSEVLGYDPADDCSVGYAGIVFAGPSST